MPYTYLYDPTGVLPANTLVAELHNVTPPIDADRANFIVPRAAPFFQQGLVIRTGPSTGSPVLVEGIDYILTHHFVEASQYLSKPIYGSVMFLNRLYNGNVYLTYNTLGGAFTLDDYGIVESLTRSLYNIRTVTWAEIAGLPVAFPVVPHPHDIADLTGMAEVVTAINDLAFAISSQGGNVASILATLTNHITGVASHNKSQVGLSLVENLELATQTDVDNIVTNKYMTPAMTHHAITRFNMGGVSVMDSTTVLKGITRFATTNESNNELTNDETIAVTPSGLWAGLSRYSELTQISVDGIYQTTNASANPGTVLGYGTWTLAYTDTRAAPTNFYIWQRTA